MHEIRQPGKGLGGSVLRHRAPLRVNDYVTTSAVTHEYDQAVRAERFTSVFAVPVLVWGEVRGVLYGAVPNRRPDRAEYRRDSGRAVRRCRDWLGELTARDASQLPTSKTIRMAGSEHGSSPAGTLSSWAGSNGTRSRSACGPPAPATCDRATSLVALPTRPLLRMRTMSSGRRCDGV
jgi:hypothetical protein